MYGFHGLVRAACIVWCCLFAVQVTAAVTPIYVKTKYGYAKKIQNWTHVRVDYLLDTANIPPGSTIPKNKQVSVYYDKPSVVNKAKKFKRATPFDLAVAGAVAAMGYAMDELSGQITRKEERPVSQYPDDYMQDGYEFECGDSWATRANTVLACAHATGKYPDWDKRYSGFSNGTHKVNIYFPDGRLATTMPVRPTPCTICLPPETEIVDVPISDSELDDVMDKAVERASERQLKPLFADGANNPYAWPEWWDVLRDWMRDVAGTDPNLTYDVDNNRWVYVNPTTGETTTSENEPQPDPTDPNFDPTTQAPPQGVADLPAFCDWAKVVCEWLEWTKEQPENMEPDEFPVEQLTADDFRQDYSPGLGSGSCPGPVTFTLQGESGQFTYDNACMAASQYFKPVLLTIAGMLAAFIIVGASKRAV